MNGATDPPQSLILAPKLSEARSRRTARRVGRLGGGEALDAPRPVMRRRSSWPSLAP